MNSWRTRLTRPVALWIMGFAALATVVVWVAASKRHSVAPSGSATVWAAGITPTTTTTSVRPTVLDASILRPTTTAPSPTTVLPASTVATTTVAPRVVPVTTTEPQPEPTTTEPEPVASTIATTTTTITPKDRSIDLRVQAAFVGPPIANRATFVSVTVSNAGPHAALAPRVNVVVPIEYTDVVSLEPAWSCRTASGALSCDGPALAATMTTSFALRGKLSDAVVLQSEAVGADAGNPLALTPKPLQFAVSDQAQGATDIDGSSDVAQLAFPPTIAERGLATLTARTIHGGLAMTGNTLLTCDVASPTCAAAMTSGDNISAVMTPTNALATSMTGTTASSSANLQLVPGATVAEAYLVWGAVSMDGRLAPNGMAVAWMSTVATGVASVRTSLQSVGANDFYARADVTDLVRQQGSGMYGVGLVGGLAGVNGANQSAGWALVVVYERATDPVRSVVVLDGLSVMGGGAASTIQLGSLGPVASARSAAVGFVTFDGDRGQADVICVNDVRVSDASNPTTVGPCDEPYPTDDAFNGTVSLHGVVQPVDGAGNTTSLGFDVDLIDTALPREASSRLLIAATADVVRVALVAIVIDV
jgi:hypothetical protein